MYPEYMELQGNRRSGTLYKEIIKLQQKYNQLQSNWNSLREFVIQLQKIKGINQQGFSWGVAQEVLDKMNELEGDK